MKKTTLCGFRINLPAIKLVTLSSLLVLTACTEFKSENASGPSQQELLAELEKNQLTWLNSGVSEYSLAVQTDCDCPDEVKSNLEVVVDAQGGGVEFARGKTGGISGRDRSSDSDDNVSSFSRNNQTPGVQTLFTDLRQAILQNAVQRVSYDPNFGFPQTVLVNNAVGQPYNLNSNSNNNSFSPLRVQANNFQVIRTNNSLNSVSLNGQLIRQNNSGLNSASQLWLIGNDGVLNQLNVPVNLLSTVNSLPNQSNVQVTGQRLPGGINGQGYINVQQITPAQAFQANNNLSGTLNYSVVRNGSFDVDDFFVTNDSGRNVFLNVSQDLRNQAFGLAGQRIRSTGSWTPAFTDPNARFTPDVFNTVNVVLESFNGILMSGATTGVFQSGYVLASDNGSILELQVPAIFGNSFSSFVGKRVEIQGTRLNAGGFGQQVIAVKGLKEIQNIFTSSQQINGVISAVYPATGFDNIQRVLVQMDTGNSVTVQIPSNFTDIYNPLVAGMRIQVTGAWISSSAFGQGEFAARAPVQITNLGYATATTYSGFISNVGAVGNGANCNATQNSYGFTSDNGQQFQLYVNNTTQITGLTNQGLNLPYQARIQVSGTQIAPGILQAQSITVSQQFETTISGTIIEIGTAGNTFTCTGPLNTYRLLDSFGNAYSITTSASSLVQGSQGAFLRIGDQVRVNGIMSNTGTTFYASQIIATAAGYPNAPYIPGPTPNTDLSTFVGTITGLDCTNSFADTYNFVDQFGTLYRVSVNMDLQAGMYIDVGTQLQITGSVISNEIIAQQIVQLQTFADPLIRTPMSGTIISMTSNSPSSCNTPVYIYQFQNDNGQIQQLRLTNEAAQHVAQPIANNTRITITSRLPSANPQLIDALDIEYLNGQSFGAGQQFGGTGFQTTVVGTITVAGCNNEYYFVDQSGMGYRLQLNAVPTNVFVGAGSRLNVTGQIIGNQLIASNVYTDQSQVYLPTPAQASGTIMALVNTETLNCGVTINTYTFQNDNGRSQRLRVTSSATNSSGQYLTVGSRVVITNKVESFDGSVIDALNITQQAFF